MKKILISLCLLIVSVSVFAQESTEVFENDYFSVELPNGWIGQELDAPLPNFKMYFFINSEEDKISFIYVFNGIADSNKVLKYIASSLLKDATSGNIYTTTFNGKNADAVDIAGTFENEKKKGTTYLIHYNNNSIIIVDLHGEQTTSNSKELWNSLKFKNYTKSYLTFEEELKDFVTTMNNANKLKGKESITDTIGCDFTKKQIIAGEKVNSLSKSNISTLKIDILKKFVKRLVSKELNDPTPFHDIVKRALNKGYTLKYNVYDKDLKFIFNFYITANDLKQ